MEKDLKKEEKYYIPKNNMISILINVIAVLILACGVGAALYYGSFIYFISTFIGAIFVFAIAEVINLQQKTLYMIDKIYTKKI